MLCVGLDPDLARIPAAVRARPDPIFSFCRDIVDATADLVCAFKPQIAYFAAHRAEDQLQALIGHIHAHHPGIAVVLDAKRGDIGSTAEQYAREAFERYDADAVTLSPFMGLDSIEPYMRYEGRGLILLCRTSNPGGSDLQAQPLAGGGLLYEHIARLAATDWNRGGQLGLVVGATFPQELARVRALAPTLPLLVPGVGAQGGDARATVHAAWGPQAPLVVSSSRAVLYAWQAATAGTGMAADAGWMPAARAAAQATRAQLQQAVDTAGR
jgi:orotidine-5'-phosphate decarboxylase